MEGFGADDSYYSRARSFFAQDEESNSSSTEDLFNLNYDEKNSTDYKDTMLEYVASYIWGSEEEEEEEILPECIDNHEVEDEWILVGKKGRKAIRTDKQDKQKQQEVEDEEEEDEDEDEEVTEDRIDDVTECHLPETDEQYMETTVADEERQQNVEERIHEVTKEAPKSVGTGNTRMLFKHEIPLRSLTHVHKSNTGKNLKRTNKVHTRVHSARKNKQYGRMEGKHVGMVGKRGCNNKCLR